MRYRLQRHDGTDCSATMVPFTVLRMVPIQRYRHHLLGSKAKITVRVPLIPSFNTEADVEHSIAILQKMGVRDIDRFSYIIKHH